MMSFTGIAAQDTHLYMPEAWELLRPAAERNGHHTEESVRAALLRSDFQLWCAFKGEQMVMATITEIAQYPAVRQCIVILCGGKDMDDWLYPCLSAIEAWAKEKDCQRMFIEGRPGWRKALPGYSQSNVVLVKDLRNA